MSSVHQEARGDPGWMPPFALTEEVSSSCKWWKLNPGVQSEERNSCESQGGGGLQAWLDPGLGTCLPLLVLLVSEPLFPAISPLIVVSVAGQASAGVKAHLSTGFSLLTCDSF